MVKKPVQMHEQTPDSASLAAIDEDAIIERGFEIFLQRLRLGRPGDAISDWQQAEMELRLERVRRLGQIGPGG
jgi:hypothetical protein